MSITLPSATVEALKTQYDSGCNLVAAYARGESKGRCECNPSWKRNPASWRVIEEHLGSCEGAEVGIVPYSGDLTATVLDLDCGDVSEVSDWHRPDLVLPSLRSGRAHLWYADVEPRQSLDWRVGDSGGEVRSGNGFVIETYADDSPVLIVERFLSSVDDLSRRDLFSLKGIEVSGSTFDSSPVIDVAEYSGMVDGDGRNQRLFDDLRQFARLEVSRHTVRSVFEASVTQLAFRLNALFDEPEDSSRVGSIIRSVVDWSWERKGVWRMSELSPESRVLGGARSGISRRRLREVFDAEVQSYRHRGYNVATIAVLTGRSERSVYQAQARLRGSVSVTESNSSTTESVTESNSGFVTEFVTPKADATESKLSVQVEVSPRNPLPVRIEESGKIYDQTVIDQMPLLVDLPDLRSEVLDSLREVSSCDGSCHDMDSCEVCGYIYFKVVNRIERELVRERRLERERRQQEYDRHVASKKREAAESLASLGMTPDEAIQRFREKLGGSR